MTSRTRYFVSIRARHCRVRVSLTRTRSLAFSDHDESGEGEKNIYAKRQRGRLSLSRFGKDRRIVSTSVRKRESFEELQSEAASVRFSTSVRSISFATALSSLLSLSLSRRSLLRLAPRNGIQRGIRTKKTTLAQKGNGNIFVGEGGRGGDYNERVTAIVPSIGSNNLRARFCRLDSRYFQKAGKLQLLLAKK